MVRRDTVIQTTYIQKTYLITLSEFYYQLLFNSLYIISTEYRTKEAKQVFLPILLPA